MVFYGASGWLGNVQQWSILPAEHEHNFYEGKKIIRDGKIDIPIAGLLESNSFSVLFLGCLSIQNAMCSYPSMSVIYSDIRDTPMFDG